MDELYIRNGKAGWVDGSMEIYIKDGIYMCFVLLLRNIFLYSKEFRSILFEFDSLYIPLVIQQNTIML